MRNITVTVDDDTHRLARLKAAELDTSVSALVRDFLRRVARGSAVPEGLGRMPVESETDRRRRLLRAAVADITAEGGGLDMADNLSREAIYERSASR